MTDNRIYSDLSAYYDLMCSGIDYQEQSDAVFRIHKLFGAGGLTYLDLACGSGPHLQWFLHYGYQATGLDLNPAMLVLAQNRCATAHFSQQNMANYQFPQKFDLITCFLYSIHYCYPIPQFFAAFKNTYDALNDGGVFCFDMVIKDTIANDQGTHYQLLQGAVKFHFQSRWYYPGKGDKLDLFLAITRTEDGRIEISQDQHTMLAMDMKSHCIQQNRG